MLTDFAPDAHRLAMELECLLLECADTRVVSKWWDSANEALDQHRAFCATIEAEATKPQKPAPIPSGEDYAETHKMAVTSEWLAGWNNCKELVEAFPVGAKPKTFLQERAQIEQEWSELRKLKEAEKPNSPAPKYSWSADGRTVTFTNYDECSAASIAATKPQWPVAIVELEEPDEPIAWRRAKLTSLGLKLPHGTKLYATPQTCPKCAELQQAVDRSGEAWAKQHVQLIEAQAKCAELEAKCAELVLNLQASQKNYFNFVAKCDGLDGKVKQHIERIKELEAERDALQKIVDEYRDSFRWLIG